MFIPRFVKLLIAKKSLIALYRKVGISKDLKMLKKWLVKRVIHTDI